jgi:hypothetical protein
MIFWQFDGLGFDTVEELAIATEEYILMTSLRVIAATPLHTLTTTTSSARTAAD